MKNQNLEYFEINVNCVNKVIRFYVFLTTVLQHFTPTPMRN